MDKGYDNASFFYDWLSGVVFGRQLQQAQSHFLHLISPGASVLIVGGGSGWILEEMARVQPAMLSITYVDASPKMVALARKRATGAQHAINFIDLPIQQADIATGYDVIITPFFFDNFTESEATEIFMQLHGTLRKGGLWLYTDFRDNGIAIHRLVLKGMYLFFSLLCGVRARRLPNMHALFSRNGYVIKTEAQFVKGFVESKAWIR